MDNSEKTFYHKLKGDIITIATDEQGILSDKNIVKLHRELLAVIPDDVAGGELFKMPRSITIECHKPNEVKWLVLEKGEILTFLSLMDRIISLVVCDVIIN